MNNKVLVGVRLQREMVIALETFIVDNGLHKYKIKLHNLATIIIQEWLENPVLDRSKIVFGTVTNAPRSSRISIRISNEENIKLYEIYVKEYIRECASVNMMIYNIILQFIENKGTISALQDQMEH